MLILSSYTAVLFGSGSAGQRNFRNMGNCFVSGMRPEVAIRKIVCSELKNKDFTDSSPSTVQHATAKSCGPLKGPAHSQKKQIRRNKEEKKPRLGSPQNGLSGGTPDCRRVKVVISAKKLSEFHSDGHIRKDDLVSFLLEKVQTDGCSCIRAFQEAKPAVKKRFAGWMPSLEIIPEESSSTC